MKSKKMRYSIFGLTLLMLVLLSACNEFEEPPTIWNPDKTFPDGSSVTKIIPEYSALAGVRKISIVGKFADSISSNWVYFGSEQAIIERISNAADTLVVYRPSVSGVLDVKVIAVETDSITKYSYNLETPINSSDIRSITGNYLVMEAGKGDTMWIASKGYINKLSPNGIDLIPVKDTSYLKPLINKLSSDFAQNFSDLKFGPQGLLYATFNTQKSNAIYKLHPDSTTPIVYVKFTANNSTSKFDFNSNGDIYTGYKNGLFLVKEGSTPVSVGDYSGITFLELRIINGYVYVANSTSIFRSLINSDGTVGNKETVINLALDSNFSGCTISSFNLSSEGTIFLSLFGKAGYSLFVFEYGLLSPYYQANILPTGIDQLIWGNDRYLYLSKGKTGAATDTRFYKMGMAKEDNSPLLGAPYLGRDL